MVSYNKDELVQTVLEEYFKKNDFGKDGGLDTKWVKIKVGKFYFPYPNSKARKKALVFHDVHHLVTGFDTNWRGEVGISAWEISSGCGKLYAAWILDFWAMAIGLSIYPKTVFNSFILGRRTLNLYHETFSYEEAKQMKIGELRKHLKFDDSKIQPATGKDIFAFINYSIIAILAFVIPFLPSVFLIWWIFYH